MIFALDCSQSGLCLALLRGGELLASYCEAPCAPQSSLLLKKIDDVFKSAGLTTDDVDRVLFSHGPGSFTSLRVGHATLAGLFSAGRQIHWGSCSSLLLRCLVVPRAEETVVVLMRAGRERIYCGFLSSAGAFNESVMSPKSIRDELLKLKGSLIIAGDGLALISETEKSDLMTQARLIEQDPIRPEAFLLALQSPLIDWFSSPTKMRLNYLLEPDIGSQTPK